PSWGSVRANVRYIDLFAHTERPARVWCCGRCFRPDRGRRHSHDPDQDARVPGDLFGDTELGAAEPRPKSSGSRGRVELATGPAGRSKYLVDTGTCIRYHRLMLAR